MAEPGGQSKTERKGTRSPQLDGSVSDPYAVLGLEREASADLVRERYFELVRSWSPEREPETFKRIRSAYEALRSPDERAETDLFSTKAPPDLSLPASLDQPNLAFDAEDAIRALLAWGEVDQEDFEDDFREVNV